MPDQNGDNALPRFTIKDHRLASTEASVIQVDNPKNTRELRPTTIVIHYTAGASARSSADSLADENVKASAHLVVGRTPDQIYQVTPFDVVAWHAGKSEYTFPNGEVRKSFNGFSIGIEIDNPGELTATLAGHRTWFGRTVPADEVVEAVHRNQTVAKFWHAYGEKQIAMVQEICRSLVVAYPDIEHILGHEEISPGRKSDPGPAFPLDRLRSAVLGANRRDDTAEALYPSSGSVTASSLNIRAAASGDATKVAMPLKSGAPVTALEEKNGWLRVRATVEGWVSGSHVKLDRG